MRIIIFQVVKHDRNGRLIGLHSQFQITVIVHCSSKLARHVAVIRNFSKLVNFLTAGETFVCGEAFVVFVFQLPFGFRMFGFFALAVCFIIGVNELFAMYFCGFYTSVVFYKMDSKMAYTTKGASCLCFQF